MLELLIALAVASILTLMAVPNLRPFIQNNRNITQINELQTTLNAARTAAVTRNNTVSICGSTNGTGCGADLGIWQNGWIAFVDEDADGTVDEGDLVIRTQGGMVGGTTLILSDDTAITYASSGLAITGANEAFTICDDRGAGDARGLIIGVSGRLRLAVDSNDNDIVEDESNTDLVCAE
jgi:type IV fimbrial biogenesis protein FimT